MAKHPRKIMIPTVFVCEDEYSRYTIAGWVYDREDKPEGAWYDNAWVEGWEDQIVDFARRFPIDTVLMRFDRRPWVEHTIEQWARKYKRTHEIAKVLADRRGGERLDLSKLTVPHRNITKT